MRHFQRVGDSTKSSYMGEFFVYPFTLSYFTALSVSILDKLYTFFSA